MFTLLVFALGISVGLYGPYVAGWLMTLGEGRPGKVTLEDLLYEPPPPEREEPKDADVLQLPPRPRRRHGYPVQ